MEDVWLEYKARRSFFRHDRFMALEALNLTLNRGEVLGVIGGNGSGKSTLLRVLAGVYRPDRGQIKRFCGNTLLLSLALGFDPELSGRENALISGVLLGARRQRVVKKMDQIISFAELDDCIDDPLKTYSSGMRARLGFSVAFFVEADLLLIDEVLSVGDANFRLKAEKSMRERISSEQTVVFVSHSSAQIVGLCDRVAWIDKGRLRLTGQPQEVIEAYNGHQCKSTSS
ncbi:MAG: ABC transporter ATP-binding protein [Verrucomicrobiota bacterium]